jgi:hypothetical protein
LAHRDRRDDVIDQVGGGFRHAPRAAGGAKAASLAGKRDQLLMGALGAAQAEKPVREDAAFEKGIELGAIVGFRRQPVSASMVRGAYFFAARPLPFR